MEERLLETIQQINVAEPGTMIVVAGDFNQNLLEPNNKLRPVMERCNMKVGTYQGNSFFRPNMKQGSKIDHIVASNELTVEMRVLD